ncbi:DUF4097 family beta strand repeat-containing protein [Spirochaeta lutea]|uniref:Adhesin domain-containing protein n=1 Tax=Spirochaeta lutea TaxID=1480694 RepID=A0A098QX27_9SPIO|nr:hypothetical protein [Spirochaeta lutea]KGE72400.1 hypothetical protein DC28_06920 [Spirochaeta lutea]
MKNRRITRNTVRLGVKGCFVALCLALTGMTGCQAMGLTEPFSYSEDGSGIQGVAVQNTSGSIEVTESPDNRIRIRGVKRSYGFDNPSSVNINVQRYTNTISIKTEYPQGWSSSVSVDYEIQLPAGMEITLENTTGSVEIRGSFAVPQVAVTTGSIEVWETLAVGGLQTTTGSIRGELSGLIGDQVEIQTTTGSINLRLDPDINCSIEAETVTGSYTNLSTLNKVEGTPRVLRLRTTTGSITLKN